MKTKRTPKLRFPGYTEEWEMEALSHLCSKISDGIHATPEYSDTGVYFFINGNNLMDGRVRIDDNTKRVSDAEYLKHMRELGSNTLLLSINGTIGNLAYYRNERVVLGKSACYLNVLPVTHIDFLYYTLQHSRIQSYFKAELTGTTIKNWFLDRLNG